MAQKRAPPAWRRRMGTALLFLILLDFIILFPAPTQPRVAVAIAATAAVLIAIAAIWRRNTRLERLAGSSGQPEGVSAKKRPNANRRTGS